MDIAPLDMILFRGVDLIGNIVGVIQHAAIRRSEYSHIALVINSELLPSAHLQPGKLYVWESTVTSSEDPIVAVETGKKQFGAQIRPLDELVYIYTVRQGGQVYWAPLRNNPWRKREERRRLQQRFQPFYEKYKNSYYEWNMLTLLSCVFPQLLQWREYVYSPLFSAKYKVQQIQPAASWIFCSELVARAYQDLGILPTDLHPQSVAPLDFLGIRDKRLDIIEGKPIRLYMREGGALSRLPIPHTDSK